MGMYSVLAILWLFLTWREIELGPEHRGHLPDNAAAAVDD
jgi:hypothetical protein